LRLDKHRSGQLPDSGFTSNLQNRPHEQSDPLARRFGVASAAPHPMSMANCSLANRLYPGGQTAGLVVTTTSRLKLLPDIPI
jgi:hypothetical protein